MKRRLLILKVMLSSAAIAFGQGPSEVYLRSMNSLLPGSPESAQLMKYQDYPVSLFSGTPQISVPIFNAAGKDISVPISLSYHAGGGVKVNDLATNIGLGWSLIAGGEISREMRSGPDEGGTAAGFLNKPYPMSWYEKRYDSLSHTYTDFEMWVSTLQGALDLEPDIFSFSFGNYSGKFIYDDSLNKFVCVTDNQSLNIEWDRTNIPQSFFTITVDDGTKYIFANHQRTRNTVINRGSEGGATSWSPLQTTSWKLSKIINADATDSILFHYTGEYYTYYSEGSHITYQTIIGVARAPMLSFSNNQVEGQCRLQSISGRNFSVELVDEVASRLDLPGDKGLEKIIIRNADSSIANIFVLHHSYFNRNSIVGSSAHAILGSDILKSLRLDSISNYGNSLSNTLPERHTFAYDPKPLPARLSFETDWWGYANSNTYFHSLVPSPVIADGLSHPGADRRPDFEKGRAAILTEVKLPTGGKVNFVYEPNTSAFGVENARPDPQNMLGINHVIRQLKGANQYFSDSIVYFTVNVPANPALNNTYGGVIANLSIFPTAPGSTPPPTGLNSEYPYYTLEKISGSGYSFNKTMQYAGEQGVHLPNGEYKMTFHVYNYNQHLPPLYIGEGAPEFREIYFTVNYEIPDTSNNVLSYQCGGLRVKSITTTEPYTNMKSTRHFRYHNPVNDSSYGAYIGSARNEFVEVSADGQWRVRMGSYNLPGLGSMASSVVYPLVEEEVIADGITHRIRHQFTMGYPLYTSEFPFTPMNLREHIRGNESKTTWYKQESGSFIPAKTVEKIYDHEPYKRSNPSQQFQRRLIGIRTGATSYDLPLVISGGYAPTVSAKYEIWVNNRVYVTSDTTIEAYNSGPVITTWNDYRYGDKNQQPVLMRTANSDGSLGITKTWYPVDGPEATPTGFAATFASQLNLANRVSQPLAVKTYKNSDLLSTLMTYGRMDGSKMLVDSLRQSLFSNNLEGEIWVTEYDNFAHPLTIKMRGDRYRKYIWYPQRNLPMATCVTNPNSSFVFTSFEYEYEYGWNTSGLHTNAFAGSRSYNLAASNLSFGGFNTLSGLEVYAWANGGFFANGVAAVGTGRTNGSWELYRVALNNNPANVTISGGSIIDNLAIVPSGASMEGNVYDKAMRLICKVNTQMQCTFFEYDAFGRLVAARDEKGHIVTQTSYQYQGDNN